MLSSVLNSERAIKVNIQIMRSFARLRKMAVEFKDLSQRLDEMEQKYDSQFKVIFDAIRLLISEPESQEKKIGFIKEQQAAYQTASGMSA